MARSGSELEAANVFPEEWLAQGVARPALRAISLKHSIAALAVGVAVLLGPGVGRGEANLVVRASFPGIGDRFFEPDATIATSPATVLIARNQSVAILNKTGQFLASKPFTEFFASDRDPRRREGVGDPDTLFDPDSGRFFLVLSDRIKDRACVPGTCVALILLAVSKSASPMTLEPTDWYFYAFDRTLEMTSMGSRVTANWGDFDKLAVVANLLVISMSMYSLRDNSTQGAMIRILQKSLLVNGGPVTGWADFVGFGQSFPRAVVTFGNPGVVFLAVGARCHLQIFGISNPLSSATVSEGT